MDGRCVNCRRFLAGSRYLVRGARGLGSMNGYCPDSLRWASRAVPARHEAGCYGQTVGGAALGPSAACNLVPEALESAAHGQVARRGHRVYVHGAAHMNRPVQGPVRLPVEPVGARRPSTIHPSVTAVSTSTRRAVDGCVRHGRLGAQHLSKSNRIDGTTALPVRGLKKKCIPFSRRI